MSTVDGHVYERVAIRQWLLEHAAQSTSSRPGASAHAPSGAPRQHQIELRAASSPSQPRPAPALGQLGGTFWLVGHTGPDPDTNPNPDQARHLAQDGRGARGEDPHPVPRAPRHDHPISGGPRRRRLRRRRRWGWGWGCEPLE